MFFALVLLLVATAAGASNPIVAPAALESAPYAEWAHHHWVWLDEFHSNRSTCQALIDGYQSRDIRVGAIDLEPNWMTCLDNFEWNVEKYPDPAGMVKQWHDQGVRVILWATSMVNKECDNYAEAQSKGYFVRNAMDKEMSPIHWWHGHGSLIDYTNPDALAWWHQQMDKALDYGIDGWKTDGTDPYILELLYPRGYKGRHISYRDYANAYYGDFLAYSRQKLGNDRLIMSRPVDSFGPLFISFSPKDVMFSGWVGDLDPTWDGYKIGLERLRASSLRGYLNFGTDIAAYRGCGEPLCRELALYMRWFSLGAFCPLMENGGNDDHMPWDYDTKYNPGSNTTAATYKKMVDTHYSLVPYFLTTATQRYAEQRSSMEFLSKSRDDFRYLLGDNILVAPVLSNATTMEMVFPKGDDWQDWWNSSITHKAGSRVTIDVPYTTIPVYQRAGSIIPLSGPDADDSCPRNSSRDIVARIALSDIETRLVACESSSTQEQCEGSTEVREFESNGMILAYKIGANRVVSFSATAHKDRRVAFQVASISRPAIVKSSFDDVIPELSSSLNAGCSLENEVWWNHDLETGVLTVHTGDNSVGTITRLSF